MDISLWEWDADVVLIQGVVYQLQHIAYHYRALRCLGPYHKLHVHARISHLCNHNLCAFLWVDGLMALVVHGFFYHADNLFEVRSVCHTKWYSSQHVAVIPCKVLVVLSKQLCVLECNHLALTSPCIDSTTVEV